MLKFIGADNLMELSMKIYWNENSHLKQFVELNNAWIEQYFKLEKADLELAADPGKILRDGGHILTMAENNRVLGCCALFNFKKDEYELARMAVLDSQRGNGIGKLLMNEALDYAKRIPNIYEDPEMEFIINQYLDYMLNGLKPVDEVCKKITETIDKRIERKK